MHKIETLRVKKRPGHGPVIQSSSTQATNNNLPPTRSCNRWEEVEARRHFEGREVPMQPSRLRIAEAYV